MNGDDPAGKDAPFGTPFGTPFGNEPIDRSSIAPRSDAAPTHDPIDDIPFDGPEDPSEDWDKDDQRRQKDCFAPPKEPCECYCLHCQRTFMSDKMWFQRVIGDKQGFDGFWMCPTHNCSGSGFTFDIFPTDPDHPANAGWHDDDEDYEADDDVVEDEQEVDEFDPDDVGNVEAVTEYDPDESKYKQLDNDLGDGEDDFADGDEWKLGVAPGEEVPPQMYWPEAVRKEWESEQADYDAPDRRPRELDWSNREDRDGGTFNNDDIPF